MPTAHERGSLALWKEPQMASAYRQNLGNLYLVSARVALNGLRLSVLLKNGCIH